MVAGTVRHKCRSASVPCRPRRVAGAGDRQLAGGVHQLGERRRLVLDLRLRQHPVDDVVFDGERLELVRAARASRSASARRPRAARRSARPPAPAPSPARASRCRPCARTSSARIRPSATRSSAPARNISGVSLMSSAFIPCSLQVRGHPLRHALRLDARPASCGSASSAFCAQRGERLLLHLAPRSCASARAAGWPRSRRRSSSTLPLAMPNALRELGVDRRAACGSLDRLHRQRRTRASFPATSLP